MPPPRYTRRSTYTLAEQMEAEIADLLVDEACAIRDGLSEYAGECRLAIMAKTAEFEYMFHREPTLRYEVQG